MKVFVRGKGEVTLAQSDFVAQGGQASVYRKGASAYKVYSDPKAAIPEAKFGELARIQDPHVVKPEDLLLEPRTQTTIGYTMGFVQNTHSLCQLFTRAFRDRNSVTNDRVIELTGRLREHVANVHKAGVVIVDLNELNILVDSSFADLFLIDVDSYQTRSFRAEVIMPSVRDWSVSPSQYSDLSDWFSYAVLAFQMFVGLHPYKGRHDKSASVPPEQRLEHRMKSHVSAFNAEVSVPKVCYPVDVIPQTFREWLRAVLEDGKRLAPPDPKGGPIAALPIAAPTVVFTGGSLVVTEIGSYQGEVLDYAESGGSRLVLTTECLYLDERKLPYQARAGAAFVGFSPRMGRPLLLRLAGGQVTVTDLRGRSESDLPSHASELQRSGERFYIRSRTRVLEVDLNDMAAGVLPTASHAVADVLESASRLWEGCAIQSMLGAVYVSLFPKSRAGYQVRVPELDAYQIVEAKFDGGVLMMLGATKGRYDRLVFRFDTEFASYDARAVENVAPAGLNFVVLPGGVCVSVSETEAIEAFGSAMGAKSIRVVDDAAIGSDMRLFRIGGRAGFARGGKLFTMSIK